MKKFFDQRVGYPFYIFLLSIFIIFAVFYFQVEAIAEEQRLNLSVDIGPHISLEIPEDISFTVEKPRQGELREIRSSLYINTNTEVELSWESTALTNKETGRSLPLGIPEDIIKKLTGSKRLLAEEQPFGLNAVLIDKKLYRENSLSSYDILTKENRGIYKSDASKDKDKLFNKNRYVLQPGNYDFDIVVHYYWSEAANWSQITAGLYQGEITYTVSAVE